MAADAPNALLGLPVSIQGLVEAGAFIGTLIVSITGYVRSKKTATVEADPKAVTVAVAAPMGDPNQLRQVVDGLNRLSDFAEHGLGVLEEIRDAQNRTNAALVRNEESNNRVERAVRAVDDTISRQPRR